jgi:sugar lactone lactonase YvrE
VVDCSVLSSSRDRVGESPVWSVAEQALYWVDIEGRCIRRFDWSSQTQQTWTLPERVGCMALSSRRTVIAAMETGVFEVRLADNPVPRLLASVRHASPHMRFNDGRVDASGRLWVGSMQMDMSLASTDGALYCLDENGLSAPKVSGLITPNGSAFSPDGKRMYLSDSHPLRQSVWTFDFDVRSAGLTNRQQWVDMRSLPGRPDGAAVDAEGRYWICGNDAGVVHCFTPEGALLRSVAVPVSKPAMCAFGGPELDMLFVTSITPSAPVEGFDACLDGAVFAIRPGVCGRAEPVFSRFPESV